MQELYLQMTLNTSNLPKPCHIKTLVSRVERLRYIL